MNDHTRHEQLNIESIERRLSALRPVPVQLDRDAMMYEAGRRAGRQVTRLWQGIACVLALALGGAFVVDAVTGTASSTPGPAAIVAQQESSAESTSAVPTVTPRPAAIATDRTVPAPSLDDWIASWKLLRGDATSQPSRLSLTRKVLEDGVDALPEPPASRTEDMGVWRLGERTQLELLKNGGAL